MTELGGSALVHHGRDVDDAAAFAEMLRRRLRGEQQAEHVDVEDAAILRLGDLLDRREFVDARIVDQNVQAAEPLDGRVDQALRVIGLGHIACTATALPPAAVMAWTTASAPALLEA